MMEWWEWWLAGEIQGTWWETRPTDVLSIRNLTDTVTWDWTWGCCVRSWCLTTWAIAWHGVAIILNSSMVLIHLLFVAQTSLHSCDQSWLHRWLFGCVMNHARKMVLSSSLQLVGQENVSVEVSGSSHSRLQTNPRPQRFFSLVIKDHYNVYFSFLRF
jgi:hypothetical protein